MNIEEVREYCLNLPHVTEDFPFDEFTLVMRIGGKIFTLIPLEKGGQMNLKCDPERAISLREEYSAIEAGYHMSKTNWNTLHFEHLPAELVKELIHYSYDLVYAGLTRKVKESLK
ncbi:MAG TPA: MmcQ/YjbR family DNA-binding protein [Flavobacteriales bacterium]|nr:MmcQ/YjbR family DNA-binding protein [Flavobacteriales bacterium]HPH82993.1 MmcQ/YjbR family DNA-binding protein [Flavobacteriales bacterium]